ncbi:Peptidase propeptide and YPEB domain-containing protein [Bhargavaea ginsengi]|uniref:Peptidase propeptide and YPEB domain-containing protein n=1 Tax=Bhargavaea ginsengi TaxID=426757 RepID=A0A1H6V7R4_9BACL|nr:PepSY domain-containing protein [Bhargavaea ginsengi]SEI96372.1 Peptidase propeptide and YPEB domain-containing protein [Bhargavaea ginsengi]
MDNRKWLWLAAIGAAALIVVVVSVMALRGGEAMAADDVEQKLLNMYGGEVQEIVQDGDLYRVTLERIDGVFEAVVDSDGGAIISMEKTGSVDPIPEDDMKAKIAEQYGAEPSAIALKDNVYSATVEEETRTTEAEYDAVTGEQIKESVTEKEPAAPPAKEETPPAQEETPPAQEAPKPSVRLTPGEAANIALKEVAGDLDDDIDFEETQDGGYYIVQVETVDDREADIQIHAITGKILTVSWDD